jgi:hypothetical protein
MEAVEGYELNLIGSGIMEDTPVKNRPGRRPHGVHTVPVRSLS